jgi:hypothetical protein
MTTEIQNPETKEETKPKKTRSAKKENNQLDLNLEQPLACAFVVENDEEGFTINFGTNDENGFEPVLATTKEFNSEMECLEYSQSEDFKTILKFVAKIKNVNIDKKETLKGLSNSFKEQIQAEIEALKEKMKAFKNLL